MEKLTGLPSCIIVAGGPLDYEYIATELAKYGLMHCTDEECRQDSQAGQCDQNGQGKQAGQCDQNSQGKQAGQSDQNSQESQARLGGLDTSREAGGNSGAQKHTVLIAADHGLDAVFACGAHPDVILGDYDSASAAAAARLREMEASGVHVERYPHEKDYTDLEAAIQYAIDRGLKSIRIYGATGGRLDHFMGALECLEMARRAGVSAILADPQNEIRLIDSTTVLEKAETFGTYVSLFPFGTGVKSVTLTGFYYSGTFDFDHGRSLGVSNELSADEGVISFSEGILILILARDRR